ncbi:uncharacterized protein [Eurosta solidaginis]|uniref:uncharacterized protein n=1 Tax=Eurosta solidaginis TaxID=178769 RepID=UPI003530EE19
MERGASGSSHHHPHAAATSTAAAGHDYMTHHGAAAAHSSADIEYEYNASGKSSFDNPATKKKPPKLKAINRSLSMAIDNYAPPIGSGGASSQPTMLLDDTLFVEQPLIHRSASPLPLRSAPPQTLAVPSRQMHGGGGGGEGSSRAVSPALSARQQHHQQQQHSQHAFQARQQQQQSYHHSSSTSSPTSHAVSPLPVRVPLAHQPDIYLVSSSSLGEDVGGGARGSSSSPIQFIDDYMLPPSSSHRHTVSVTHPLKKNMFRRSDTIDVHPASTFQMKKTHSFHAQQDSAATMDQLLLSAAAASSAASSRRTSSVRSNFLMPGNPTGSGGGKDISRSPSPSRRGSRSHRSFNDPGRRPIIKPESVVESQIRHPSLNDELMESLEGHTTIGHFTKQKLSLENELFVESRSRSNSNTKMEDVGMEVTAVQRAAAVLLARKSSGSFEDAAGMKHSGTHPPSGMSSSLKKRVEHPHSRQHSSQSLELDGRPSTSAAAAASAAAHGHAPHTLQLHSAAAAATAAYHFKRGTQHGRSLYLSPNNLEELQVHQRPTVLSAAAAFQGTNASASIKQAKALHSASMRLRTYRENLSATKKSKSFIADSAYPPSAIAGDEFELTSPQRRNSRPLSSAASGATVDDIKRSPRPLALTPASAAAATAFMEEKRPSFERKPSLTYELNDAAFEQVLRPFHHKVAGGRKLSMSGGTQQHKTLKKKSLSDATDDDEEADRKRKRIVCIVMTVFLCLVCASVLVVILTLTHSSSQSTHHHGPSKKIYTFSRETPVHYNVRQENERLFKETLDRARSIKNATEAASQLAQQQIP